MKNICICVDSFVNNAICTPHVLDIALFTRGQLQIVPNFIKNGQNTIPTCRICYKKLRFITKFSYRFCINLIDLIKFQTNNR